VRKRLTPAEQTEIFYRDRGNVQLGTNRQFNQFPWNIHPDDQYRRVFPDGPFDRAWEGVQKINLMSSVGTARSSFYDPNVPVFNFETKSQYGRVQQNNQASHSFGAGPASIAAQEQEYQQTGVPPSFLSMVMQRLRGGR
jgi:hypothetical protein